MGEDGHIDAKAIKDTPPETVSEPEMYEEPQAEEVKPSGSLRAALASMREENPAIESQ